MESRRFAPNKGLERHRRPYKADSTACGQSHADYAPGYLGPRKGTPAPPLLLSAALSLQLSCNLSKSIRTYQGVILQFKRSAGIFASGVFLSIAGYIFGAIFAGAAAASTSSYYGSSSSGPLVILAILGFGAALAGTIMMVVGAYRALVKIDALVVPAPAQVPASATAEA